MRKLRIAMIGQKGIPARFGGVETHVEEISKRLVSRGHDVTVFGRSRFRPTDEEMVTSDAFDRASGGISYDGVRLAFRPSIRTKHLDAASHSFLCAAESAVRGSFDIVHFHGIGPSAFAPVPRVTRRTVVSTVHALDWRQSKWGLLAKKALLGGEENGVKRSNGVIAVSKILCKYVSERYGVEPRYIPNGATITPRVDPKLIKKFGLVGGDYVLTVGRIIPDRGLHHLIDAFKQIARPIKLVVVGSESPRTHYSATLEQMADDRIIFTGDLYGEVLAELYSNCLLYVLASEVEGLPISVCEAMAFGRCVLLSDIPENMEVGGDVGVYFKTNDVASLCVHLNGLLEDSGQRGRRGQAALQRVEAVYNWDRLAEQVEAYYQELVDGK